jgi:hypothetical protein
MKAMMAILNIVKTNLKFLEKNINVGEFLLIKHCSLISRKIISKINQKRAINTNTERQHLLASD